MSIFATYSDMVDLNAYRVLSSYSYDSFEVALRSGRIAEKPPLSDVASDLESVHDNRQKVPSPFMSLSGIPNHDDFIQMVINAKATADLTESPAQITWRGYSSTINPGFKISKDSLRKCLLDALQRLNEISETEKKVIHIFHL